MSIKLCTGLSCFCVCVTTTHKSRMNPFVFHGTISCHWNPTFEFNRNSTHSPPHLGLQRKEILGTATFILSSQHTELLRNSFYFDEKKLLEPHIILLYILLLLL
jgi:hypothetical protein